MKSEIFNSAILGRRKLRFLYNLSNIELEPYFLALNREGQKVIYGRVNNSSGVKFKKVSAKAVQRLEGETFSQKVLDEVNAHIKTYRKNNQ